MPLCERTIVLLRSPKCKTLNFLNSNPSLAEKDMQTLQCQKSVCMCMCVSMCVCVFVLMLLKVCVLTGSVLSSVWKPSMSACSSLEVRPRRGCAHSVSANHKLHKHTSVGVYSALTHTHTHVVFQLHKMIYTQSLFSGFSGKRK